MAARIELPAGKDAFREFLAFRDRIYEGRRVSWPEFVPVTLPILEGASPFNEDREIQPFVAREGGEVVARLLAIVDRRYVRHRNENVGHLVFFEALPETTEAVRLLADSACEWLAERGMAAARAGFGMLEFPFVVDEYELLPPMGVRHNPPYYHSLLKEARFVAEKGVVDYKIRVSDELVGRYQGFLEAARRAGFEIVPLREIPENRRWRELAAVWNKAFARHWGFTLSTEAEFELLVGLQEPIGSFETTALAYERDEPIGAVWAVPDISGFARVRPDAELRDEERLNFLGIGVLERGRGRGVNMAMAAYAYLELIRRGAKHLSYTIVLDDNWPSRRTAEKLGAKVCANYVVYRREFRSRGVP